MVNFDNDTTIATPPGDVVKIVLLERREQCIEAIEAFYDVEGRGVDGGSKLGTFGARVLSFWFSVQAMAKRRLPKESYEEVEKAFKGLKFKEAELIELYEWLNEFVDELGLTYIDSRAKYDRSRIEDANKKKGL